MKTCETCKYWRTKTIPTQLDWLCQYCDGKKSMWELKEKIIEGY